MIRATLAPIRVFWMRLWGGVMAWLYWRDSSEWREPPAPPAGAVEDLFVNAVAMRQATGRQVFTRLSAVTGGPSSGVAVYARVDGDNAAAAAVAARRIGRHAPTDSRHDIMHFVRRRTLVGRNPLHVSNRPRI